MYNMARILVAFVLAQGNFRDTYPPPESHAVRSHRERCLQIATPLPSRRMFVHSVALTHTRKKAALTGGTLRLERALDEKERELQMQRVETCALRERLRAIEGDSVTHRSNLNSGKGNNTNRQRGSINTSPPLLGSPWEGRGGGTAPFMDPEGSRPVSPDGWAVDAPARTGSTNDGTRHDYGIGGKNSRGRQLRGGSGGRGQSSGPPGAHSAILRPPRGYPGVEGGWLDQDVVLTAARVASGGGA